MLHHLLVNLASDFSLLNLFRYLTVRSFLMFFSAFFCALYLGPLFIEWVRARQYGQSVRNDGPQSHLRKTGTPTMGGLFILSSWLVSALLWMDFLNPYVWGALVLTLGFGLIGFLDDFAKISQRNSKGLPGKLRLVLEFLISGSVVGALVLTDQYGTELHFPFFKNWTLDLGIFYVLFASFVIVGCANAVNLTDGLDGLAIVPVVVAMTTFIFFSYVTGHAEFSQYLAIPHLAGVGELAPLGAGMVAAGLGFLWFNTYPAQVFMGDVGSLSLGGLLGYLAVVTKNELLLVVIGGVFVVEALSVIAQVASFKLTGKRVLRMAPIHHHFELKGMEETKIIVRFWIVSLLLAVLSLSTLKLR